jgi:hypothetical protein
MQEKHVFGFKMGKMFYLSYQQYSEIQKIIEKSLICRPFEVFSQVFRPILPFWNMSMVIYEKTMYFCFII